MAQERFGKPYIWVTWLAGLLAGEDQCAWAAWFKAHYVFDKEPSDFDSVEYNRRHKELLDKRVADLRADGWTVTKERQNAFKLIGESAVLAGKPDIIAVRGSEGLVVDVKSGQQANKHVWQVLMYLAALPRVRFDLKPLTLRGEVYYAGGHAVPVSDADVASMESRIWTQVKESAFSIPPEKVPSEQECEMCSIPKSECADRLAVPAAVGETKDF